MVPLTPAGTTNKGATDPLRWRPSLGIVQPARPAYQESACKKPRATAFGSIKNCAASLAFKRKTKKKSKSNAYRMTSVFRFSFLDYQNILLLLQ